MEIEMKDILFVLTKDDLRCMLEEMGYAPGLADDTYLFLGVKKGLMWGLESWSIVMREAILETMAL